MLLLSVDRETYQQLGLEGVPSPFEARQKKKDVQQYRVSVDLRAPSFRAGKALHDRVQQYAAALSALDLLVSFHVGARTRLSPCVCSGFTPGGVWRQMGFPSRWPSRKAQTLA